MARPFSFMPRLSSIGLAVVLACGSLAAAAAAAASPSAYQRFVANLGPSADPPSPGPVPLAIRFFQDVGLKGGPLNLNDLNSGAVLESPAFATVFAYIWLPREISISLDSFRACRERTILDSPASCPPGSEVGKKNPVGSDPDQGRDLCLLSAQAISGPHQCSSYAAGLLRSKVGPENPNVSGRYLLASRLTLRIFNVARNRDGRPSGDTLGLRVFGPSSGNIVVKGKLSRVSRRDIKKFGQAVRGFRRKIRFEIPSGLIEPATGSISQLTDFRAELRRVINAGRSLVTLRRCPRSGKVPFAYSADYNSNLDVGNKGLGTNSASNGLYSVSEVGSVSIAHASCRR